MITRLPYWTFSDIKPAFYELDSKTAVEMVGRLYAKMQELIDDYNKFVDEINQNIEDYENETDKKFECFKARIEKICHDYIEMMDEKIKSQDKVIADSIVYIKDNITEVANTVIRELIENGRIKVSSSYEEETKKLSILITNIDGEGV